MLMNILRRSGLVCAILFSFEVYGVNTALNPDLLVSVSCEAGPNLAELTKQKKDEYPELYATIIFSNLAYGNAPGGYHGYYRRVKLKPDDLSDRYYVAPILQNSFAAISPTFQNLGVTSFPLKKIKPAGLSADEDLLSVIVHYGNGYNLAGVTQSLNPAMLDGSNSLHVHIYNLSKRKSKYKIPQFDVLVSNYYRGLHATGYLASDLAQQSLLGHCYMRSSSY